MPGNSPGPLEVMTDSFHSIAERLNALLEQAGMDALDCGTAKRFSTYFNLLVRWNERMNLTAIRDKEGILSRHFVESIACARFLPVGVKSVLDFGSGAGFPGIPIALCRPEIAVTLAESRGKKAAFLREAIRVVGFEAVVHAGRAEELPGTFECVALRAVDRMQDAAREGLKLVSPGGWLVLMTSEAELQRWPEFGDDSVFRVQKQALPGSERGLITKMQTPGNLGHGRVDGGCGEHDATVPRGT